jgi:hypothetical protein
MSSVALTSRSYSLPSSYSQRSRSSRSDSVGLPLPPLATTTTYTEETTAAACPRRAPGASALAVQQQRHGAVREAQRGDGDAQRAELGEARHRAARAAPRQQPSAATAASPRPAPRTARSGARRTPGAPPCRGGRAAAVPRVRFASRRRSSRQAAALLALPARLLLQRRVSARALAGAQGGVQASLRGVGICGSSAFVRTRNVHHHSRVCIDG